MAVNALTCGWAADVMEEFAPVALALEHDNVGFLLGEREKPLKKVLVALDLTDAVADEAVDNDADLVLTHHPLIHNPIGRITSDNALGRRLMKLIRHDIAVYSAHTNLDAAPGGVNDVLAGVVGLIDTKPLEPHTLLGRVGQLDEPCTLGELALRLKARLGLSTVGITGEHGRMVQRIGLCSGSASGVKYLEMAAAAGCDAYISGDVTYHNAQAAVELGIGLIDATHFGTEVIIVKTLSELFAARAARSGADLVVMESKAETTAQMRVMAQI